jgi:hypothetical protein
MQLPVLQFNIERLHYFPTMQQTPVLLRPYVFNVENNAMEVVGQKMQENKTGRITPAMLSGIAGGIVQTSATGYESSLNAEWVSTPRFLFMMKVSYHDHSGGEINTYIFGYTDHDGFSQQGSIDPSMLHHVNNIVETSVYHQQTPLGTKRVEKLSKVYNTIYSKNDRSNVSIYTQRPMDMFDIMASNDLASIMPTVDSITPVTNYITNFSNNSVSSANDNGITTSYLASILTGGIHATKNREMFIPSMTLGIGGGYGVMGDDPTQRFFDEPSVADNQFLRTLNHMTGSRVVQPYFMFGSLMTMDQSINDRATLFNLTNDFASPIMSNTPQVGDHWNGQDMVTVKAFSLIENSVSMATKFGFTKLSFMVTNMMDMIGTINITILEFNSFLNLTDEDHRFILRMFEDRFRTDIFMSESNCGQIPIFMQCHVNLIGTSKIYLEYAGQPGTWFTVPTFASSLYSSVITTDKNTMEWSASELGRTLNILTDALQPNTYQQVYQPNTY